MLGGPTDGGGAKRGGRTEVEAKSVSAVRPMEFEFCGAGLETEDDEMEQNDSDDSDDNIPLAVFERSDSVAKITVEDSPLAKSAESDLFAAAEISYCPKCNKACKNRKKLKSHVRKSHGKKFKCDICTYTTDESSRLEDHYNVHSGNRPYSCYLCENATFKTESALRHHVKKQHSDRPVIEKKKFRCELCGKMLSSACRLAEHTRLHTGEKPVICKLCGKSFTRDCDLKQHLNLHDEMWKCKVCQKCFSTPFRLKEHNRSHTGELPYECDKCERKFARVADFRYHVGTHAGAKPYACGDCGARFTTSSSVRRHRLNSHEKGPRPLACARCPKTFYTASRLNAHAKLHEDKKKYKCELCPAARGSLTELQKHALIHGGEFRCDTCHRGFGSAERLSSHAARHDIAGKPYACFVCSVGYRTSQSLNKHLATVHRDEDVPKIAPQHLCTLCGQVFELKDKLNRHLKESHVVAVIGEIRPLDDDEDVRADRTEEKKMFKNKKDLAVTEDGHSMTANSTSDAQKSDDDANKDGADLRNDAVRKDLEKNISLADVPSLSERAKESLNVYPPTVHPSYGSHYGTYPQTNGNDVRSFNSAYPNQYYGAGGPPSDYVQRNFSHNPAETYPWRNFPTQFFFENFRNTIDYAQAENRRTNIPAFSPYGPAPLRIPDAVRRDRTRPGAEFDTNAK